MSQPNTRSEMKSEMHGWQRSSTLENMPPSIVPKNTWDHLNISEVLNIGDPELLRRYIEDVRPSLDEIIDFVFDFTAKREHYAVLIMLWDYVCYLANLERDKYAAEIRKRHRSDPSILAKRIVGHSLWKNGRDLGRQLKQYKAIVMNVAMSNGDFKLADWWERETGAFSEVSHRKRKLWIMMATESRSRRDSQETRDSEVIDNLFPGLYDHDKIREEWAGDALGIFRRAVSCGSLAILKYLEKVFAFDKDTLLAYDHGVIFQYAIKRNRTSVLEWLFDNYSVTPDDLRDGRVCSADDCGVESCVTALENQYRSAIRDTLLSHGQFDTVKFLSARGLDKEEIRCCDGIGASRHTMECAAHIGEFKVTKWIIEERNITRDDLATLVGSKTKALFVCAIKMANLQFITWMVERFGFKPGDSDCDVSIAVGPDIIPGAIGNAIMRGDLAHIRFLADFGIVPNEEDQTLGRAMFTAVAYNRIEMVRWLAERYRFNKFGKDRFAIYWTLPPSARSATHGGYDRKNLNRETNKLMEMLTKAVLDGKIELAQWFSTNVGTPCAYCLLEDK